MKFWFLIIVLANVMLFLWEQQRASSGHMGHTAAISENSEKQILLVSELPDDLDGKNPDNMSGTVAVTGQADEINRIDTREPALVKGPDDKQRLKKDETIGLTGISKPVEEPTVSEILMSRKNLEQISGQLTPESLSSVHQDSMNMEHDNRADTARERTLKCYEIGPFKNKREMNAWLEQQHINAGDSQPYAKKQQGEQVTYLVYLPAAETFEQSIKNQTMLREKGVSDLWLFRKGQMRGAVSLGLFRKKTRAERLVQVLAGKGVEVILSERVKPQRSLYIRIQSGEIFGKDQYKPMHVSECAE